MEELETLDPLLHSRLRLAVVSILIASENAEFIFLQERTNSTPGNLSVQLDKLEKAGYIEIKKSFRGKKPLTTCKIRSKGRKAFENYVSSIQKYLNPQQNKI
jgi:DNA-binding MarR family transcriptional regulator